MKIAVIGAGSWGTALAQILAGKGYEVGLWARNAGIVATINTEGFNPRYLSETHLSKNIVASTSHEEVLQSADAALVVTPSGIARDVAKAVSNLVSDTFPIIICSKGIEGESGLIPLEVFESELGGRDRLAALSGPNHAEEVIRDIPSATVVASSSPDTVEFFQNLLATETFRTYASSDVVGVELCAAFKNIIAIAVGVSYGLQYGDNTAALLITRGLAEMGRLVKACGGDTMTCMGLAGAGDLIATCMSEHSRNRRFGERLAKGRTLEDFSKETHMIVEGAFASKTIGTLSRKHDVELPITEVVRKLVWEGKDQTQAVAILSGRPLTTEFWGF